MVLFGKPFGTYGDMIAGAEYALTVNQHKRP